MAAIRKLPAVEGYSKHRLADGNLRCIAFHLLRKGGANYTLLEVDTSDNKNRLSTLLLKEPQIPCGWEAVVKDLEIRLVKSSLV